MLHHLVLSLLTKCASKNNKPLVYYNCLIYIYIYIHYLLYIYIYILLYIYIYMCCYIYI